jgi:hypothetical protein
VGCLELRAQGLGGSGFAMRESGPVSSVGAKAQLGRVEQVSMARAIPGRGGCL